MLGKLKRPHLYDLTVEPERKNDSTVLPIIYIIRVWLMNSKTFLPLLYFIL